MAEAQADGWISDALAAAAEMGGGKNRLARVMVRWTRLLAAHRVVLSVILIVMGAVFSALSAGIVWQADVLQFFSSNSANVANVRAAGERSGLANYLRLDVHATVHGGPASRRDEAVIAATHQLAAKLRASGEFRTVWEGVDDAAVARAFGALVAQGPAVLTDSERAEIEARGTPEFLDKRFAAVREKLADPDGEFLLQQLRNDPLDLAERVGQKLQALSPTGKGGGGGATMQDGLLVARDKDGQLHAMIVADPLSLPSNQKAAERTLEATHGAISAMEAQHSEVQVWVVGAHRGYVENAQRVKADVTLVSMAGTLLVGAAIALYFRRVSTALLCIIPPSVGVGLALGLAGLMRVELPLILLGFVGLLCGSTTDYGIQLIAECRRLAIAVGGWDGDIPAVAARRLLGPISMSVATSVTGFAALALSDAPGLRALGLFVAAATLCIWGVTFLVLPAYLGTWVLAKERAVGRRGAGVDRRMMQGLMWAGGAAFLATSLWLGFAAFHVRFNTDSRALDGSTATMLAEERAFFDVWGDMRDRALVLVSGPTADAAMREFSRVDAFLRDQQRDGMIGTIISPAAVLPDDSTATARVAAWNADWNVERRTALSTAISHAAQSSGFKSASFTGYVDRVGNMMASPADARLAQSPAALFPGFVSAASPNSGNVTLAAIVDLRMDRPLRLATGWAQELRLRYPDIAILSGQVLIFDATERARAEAERLAPWCVLAILFPLVGYFRRLQKAWLAMVCLVVGFVWVLSAAQLFAGGLNLLSLVPVLFTLGVAVDYGVYAASDPAWKKDGQGNRLGATCLCATTTILGSGALVLAGHPVLRWLGITLVAGIAGGYLASLFIVAPVMQWMHRQRSRSGGRRTVAKSFRVAGRWAMALFLILLTLALAVPPAVQVILREQHPAGMIEGPPVHADEIAARRYAFGRSWMRWRETSANSGLWEIAAVGTPTERGTALAALASPVDVRIENEMLDQLDYFLPEEWSRWVLLNGVAANLLTLPAYIHPEYQREIFSAATSYADPHAYLAPSYPRILSYHALHDISQMLIDNPLIVPNTFACTGVVSLPSYSTPAGDGDLMLARVFDFEGGESFGRQKSITYMIPPAGEGIAFAHVAWPGLAGAVTGMNAEKIALFINAAATKDFRRIGTPTILMARDILEHAHSIADAEKIIRSTQVFVSDIVVVADGKTGKARVFEKSPAHTDYFDVDRSAVVTNHLVTPAFADDPVNRERRDEGTTIQRYARARQLLDQMKPGGVTVDRLALLLRDKAGTDGKDIGYGNRNAIDGLIACHGVIMNVTKGEMWVASWPNVEGAFVGVDVMKMLREAASNPGVSAPASPAVIPAATIMTDGTWERTVAAHTAANDAEAALKSGQWAIARSNAEKVVRDNLNFYLGHELLGRALWGAGDSAAAKVELQHALMLDPPYVGRRTAIEGLIKKCEMH